jgi:tRNA dimethylallyltransferase
MNKTCIIIAGPTAVGKTSLAIDIAKHFSTQIISADSRQCFRELHIGVAKPSSAQLAQVHHYFIDSHSVHEAVSAADFETYALAAVAAIFRHNDVAVMTGGTGLYIKAFCEGLDAIPPVAENIRQNIIVSFRAQGMEWLREEIKEHDPAFFQKGEMQNPRRMMRALEVKLSTGKSILSFQSRDKKIRNFNIVKLGLELPRAQLYERINSRVAEMMTMGLEEEVRSLFAFRELNALQTVGYAELFSYLNGDIALDTATELIKKNTRHYAKRQMTWFKKDAEMLWVNANEAEQCIPLLEKIITHI